MSRILQKVAPIGEAREKALLKGSTSYVYQTRPQGDVHAHVFAPEKRPVFPCPVILFFHGGFWDTPMPSQFVPHCMHFVSRGCIAIAVETRTSSRHGTGPIEAIEDARDAIRWARQNADMFQIDPAKLILMGSAGGALIALLAAMPKEKDLLPVDGLDCRPQALVLFSPLVDCTKSGVACDRFPSPASAKAHSPSKLVRRKLPPVLIFHGKADRIIPFVQVDRFHRAMRWRGNRCNLIDFDRAEHSFFNFNVSHQLFEHTVAASDHFLTDLGLLEPAPEMPF